jgi:hypothetical protein
MKKRRGCEGDGYLKRKAKKRKFKQILGKFKFEKKEKIFFFKNK